MQRTYLQKVFRKLVENPYHQRQVHRFQKFMHPNKLSQFFPAPQTEVSLSNHIHLKERNGDCENCQHTISFSLTFWSFTNIALVGRTVNIIPKPRRCIQKHTIVSFTRGIPGVPVDKGNRVVIHPQPLSWSNKAKRNRSHQNSSWNKPRVFVYSF